MTENPSNSKFPLYENMLELGISDSIKITALASKLRSLRALTEKDPSKREEIELFFEHISVMFYHHYTRNKGREPNSIAEVTYLGKVCSGNKGVITVINETFPLELLGCIENYVDRILTPK